VSHQKIVFPGDDGLYHWKLFLANPGSKDQGTWHDVIWSNDENVGMEHHGPLPYTESKSKGFIRRWKIAEIDEAHAHAVDATCAATRTPEYEVADKDKNCQTWIYDVIHSLI
jgi:hypothetical protein